MSNVFCSVIFHYKFERERELCHTYLCIHFSIKRSNVHCDFPLDIDFHWLNERIEIHWELVQISCFHFRFAVILLVGYGLWLLCLLTELHVIIAYLNVAVRTWISTSIITPTKKRKKIQSICKYRATVQYGMGLKIKVTYWKWGCM